MTGEVERVLTNWIELALSPVCQLPNDVSPASWVSEKFLRWWRKDFEANLDDTIRDAEMALEGIRAELERLGGWEKVGDALHECIHLRDALNDIRRAIFPTSETA